MLLRLTLHPTQPNESSSIKGMSETTSKLTGYLNVEKEMKNYLHKLERHWFHNQVIQISARKYNLNMHRKKK
jgi:hypothetical protein